MTSKRHPPLPESDALEPTAGGFTEALRASPALADVAAQLLGALFPDKRFATAREGRWLVFRARPALAVAESRRLLAHLHELVDLPQWRREYAVAREVTDVKGRRVEVLVPLAPQAYDGGEALVGPFPDQAAAQEWYGGVQQRALAADTVQVADAWLCDLFMLGELLDD